MNRYRMQYNRTFIYHVYRKSIGFEKTTVTPFEGLLHIPVCFVSEAVMCNNPFEGLLHITASDTKQTGTKCSYLPFQYQPLLNIQTGLSTEKYFEEMLHFYQHTLYSTVKRRLRALYKYLHLMLFIDNPSTPEHFPEHIFEGLLQLSQIQIGCIMRLLYAECMNIS